MGLIARQLEAAGIATVSLTSARDITRAVNPPRAVYLDFPLGHTAGRVREPELNRAIVTRALAAVHELEVPGSMVHLPYRWSDDDGWKDRVMRPRPRGERDDEGEAAGETVDDRVERRPTPQYQSPDDETAAAATHDGDIAAVREGVDY